MEEINNSSEKSADKIKLIFDVMSQAGQLTGATAQSEDIRKGADTRPASELLVAKPKMSEGLSVPSTDDAQIAQVTPPRLHLKWLMIGLVALVLVVAAYFGYKYYLSLSNSPQEPMTTSQPIEQPATKMSAEWLKKYFGSVDCDEALCGPTADPDEDGLANSQEQQYSTDPQNADSDYDGLADSDEIQVYNTDPRVADTDGDGFEDGLEARNGYSPSFPGSEKISAVEKQVIADNTEKYGLHEPTTIFLNMETFKPLFIDTTSTAPFMVSVPKGGTPETLENSVRLLYNATTSVNFVEAPEDVTAANMADYLNTLRNIPTTEASIISVAQKKIRGLDLQLDESVKFVEQNDGERMRALRAVFLKNNRVYLVFYMLPESKWQENKKLAEVIINSIR